MKTCEDRGRTTSVASATSTPRIIQARKLVWNFKIFAETTRPTRVTNRELRKTTAPEPETKPRRAKSPRPRPRRPPTGNRQDLHHGRTTDAEEPSDAKIFSTEHRELPRTPRSTRWRGPDKN